MEPSISNAELLKHKALTVRLFRKKFNKNKGDRALAEILQLSQKVTDKTVLRVNKSLFPNDVTKGYQDLITKSGKYFYRVTLPWDDKGWRLLPIEMYKEFMKKMKEFTRDFREAVNVFVEGFEVNMTKMQVALGDAYDKADYDRWLLADGSADRQAIKDAFLMEVEYGTVNTADDLRATLTEEDREVIAAHITEKNNKKFAASQEHVITRLQECITALRDRLGTDGVLKADSPIVTNLEDLCDIIPKLNISGDPKLNDLAAEAKKNLCRFDVAALKDMPNTQKAVSDQADGMLDGMKGLI